MTPARHACHRQSGPTETAGALAPISGSAGLRTTKKNLDSDSGHRIIVRSNAAAIDPGRKGPAPAVTVPPGIIEQHQCLRMPVTRRPCVSVHPLTAPTISPPPPSRSSYPPPFHLRLRPPGRRRPPPPLRPHCAPAPAPRRALQVPPAPRPAAPSARPAFSPPPGGGDAVVKSESIAPFRRYRADPLRVGDASTGARASPPPTHDTKPKHGGASPAYLF